MTKNKTFLNLMQSWQDFGCTVYSMWSSKLSLASLSEKKE